MTARSSVKKIVGSENFKKVVLGCKKLVVVDFSAKWCGPCQALKPVFEDVAEKLKGELVFAYVDVDENKRLANKYGINLVPTLLLFRKGEIEDASGGGELTKRQLESWLKRALAKEALAKTKVG